MTDETDLRNYRVPSFCPVCQVVMKGHKSTISYYNFACCADCHIQWVEGREEKWKEGWRPTSEQIAEYFQKIHS